MLTLLLRSNICKLILYSSAFKDQISYFRAQTHLITGQMLQATSNDIASKVEEAERTEQEIDAAREQYRSVAVRGSLLFFCIADLAGVDPMYQYSLAWFVALFLRTVQATPEVGMRQLDVP